MLSHETVILEQIKEYYTQLGIEIIPYCRDSQGYRSLEKVLEKWMTPIKKAIQNPSSYDQNRLLDELMSEFLAYQENPSKTKTVLSE